jgi:pimeloyl-ACP methyl ester carboxylesterase
LSAIARFDIPVAGGTLGLFRLSSGPGTAEPVIAVHGITANSHAWLAVDRALEGRAALLAVDLRGRGASSGLPGPYGMAAYAADLLAVLDACGLERAVLVDGGLTSPGLENVDPEPFLAAFLGPALARLELTFADGEAYHDWWRAHPALAGSDVADSDLVCYADHDLGGAPPELRSTVARDAVRADAHELFEMGKPAHRLTVPVEMLRAPRGLQNEPTPMIPAELAAAWAREAADRRRVTEVPDVNHYTLVMGESGARAVAAAIVRALQTRTAGPP